MWQLSTEQADALAALQRRRDLSELSAALGTAFPEVRERVAARFGELAALGAERGEAQGLTHLLALARYLACWFMLGAEFEARENHAWAKAILGDALRGEGAKVFQLCRRCRDELAKLATPGSGSVPPRTPEGFDEALGALDAALARRGQLGSLLERRRLKLGSACDIDALDLRPADSAAAAQLYHFDKGQVRRDAHAGARAAVTLMSGAEGADAWPAVLSLLAPAAGGKPARLRLRTRCGQVCDPGLHPQVVLSTAVGRDEWRGEHAQDLLVELPAEDAPPPDGAPLLPVIALEGPPRRNLLEMTSCGLRDSGQALGDAGRLSTQLHVWPQTQHLLVWQRAAAPELSWPELGSGAAEPVFAAPRVRIERDGALLDASRWIAGLRSLDAQLLKGLGRLATAWERESGVTQGRLLAEPQLLAGTAALSWGWAESPQGMLAPPFLRLAGSLDLMACQLNLRFTGTLALQGSISQLSLHCGAAEALHTEWEQTADDDPIVQRVAAQRHFSQPFVIGVEAMAHAELAMLDIAGPVHGALVGSCGLRPRPDGAGLQWFVTLEIEPVSVIMHIHDPLLGQQLHVRPLLPAMKLVDWSLG